MRIYNWVLLWRNRKCYINICSICYNKETMTEAANKLRLLYFVEILEVNCLKQKKRRGKKKNKQSIKGLVYFEIMGLALFGFSIITILKLGIIGNASVLLLRFFFGEWYMLSLFFFIGLAIFFMVKQTLPNLLHKKFIGIYLIYSTILMFSHIQLFQLLSDTGQSDNPSVLLKTWEMFWHQANGAEVSDLGGGVVGAIMLATCYFLFAAKGAVLVGFIFILLGVILITDKPLSEIASKVFSPLISFSSKQAHALADDVKEWKEERETRKRLSVEEVVEVEKPIMKEAKEVQIEPIISHFDDKLEEVEIEDIPVDNKEDFELAPVENKLYQLPSMELLKKPKGNTINKDDNQIYKNARKLEDTLHSFGVSAKVTKVHMGPSVTKYEVYPDVGVKVSKIVGLTDDLALALAAKDIRMEAPIPGKSAIGIEVPNNHIAMVTLREVLETKENLQSDDKLQVCLGRDVTGNAIFAQLNKMPHLLVAGATGSGKSVCINGIITSILMRAKPHEVKLMMIDPKMVELNVYNGIPHLLAPVVTEPKKAAQALRKIVNEMERRYELFAHSGTRNIEGYNEHIVKDGQESLVLPYIVVIVDELADLMMVASSDVEDAITRIAQMARAAGIHLIIATQRPSVDVITGVIKANIPSRIAFAVSSQVDSRTILDSAGAEKLLGRGDMLFVPIGANKPIRVQGAFLSDEEVENIVEFVISQQKAQYQEEMIPTEQEEQFTEVDDELFEDAVMMVTDMQTASVSMLQRKFRIGYARAARLIDAMEERGIVGPYEGSRPREVLIQHQDEKIN